VADYPAFGKLSQQVRQLREQVRKLPMVPQDQEALREQSRLYGEIAALSQQQEAMLREIAVSRRPAEMVFPPLVPTRELQKSIPKGTAVLAFFAAGGDLYAFLLTQDKYGFWTVKTTSAALGRKVVALLREMGNFEQNHELGAADLTNAQWKQTARQVLEGVVVPDGVLWYVPFEALQVNVNNQLQPLIARFRIRYAPTVSLAVPDRRGRSPAAETAVVVGKLYPRDDAQVAQAAYEQLAKVLPGTAALSKPPLPAPSALYKLRMGRLIVLDDLSPAEGTSVYGWAPVPIERNKPGNALDDWLALPWGGPEVIVLPGFHTVAENSLKRVNRTAPGSEVFLTVCALLSNGAQTLLISRWRTGGQSSFDLVREFAQELPHAAPSEAWQRAVLLTMATRVKTDAEPRLKRSAGGDDSLKAEHPFFWAGYLLIDNGNPAGKTEAEPDKPDAKPAPEKKPGDEKKPDARKKPDEAIKPMGSGKAQANGQADDPKLQSAPGPKSAPTERPKGTVPSSRASPRKSRQSP
jgi:CHAT domain-containing protein